MNRTYRILFASPYCLLDTTSGAAIAMRELLSQLTQRGFSCEAVTASIFDPPRQVFLEEVFTRHDATVMAQGLSPENVPFVKVSSLGLSHTIVKTARSQRQALVPREEAALLLLVEQEIGEFKPTLLLTYGGLTVERAIHRLAHRCGIPVVFFLANPFYKKVKTFSEVDLVLVPSNYLSEFYKRRLGLQSQVLRDIIPFDRYRVNHQNPRFITYINPGFGKGFTLFARLVGETLKKLPQAEFLVVEARWTQADIARAGFRLDRIPNVKVIPNQTDMRVVYGQTRVLLFPSFGHEASGRSIIEAQLNGIPILASPQGGIPENLNGGGFLLRIPDRCARNFKAIPTSEEVQPWIDQLRVLLEDKEAYDEAQRRALRAVEDFRPEKIVQTAINLFQDLLEKYQSHRTSETKPLHQIQ
jgi:glycosyltransferase involved in cell wall biosynthesis